MREPSPADMPSEWSIEALSIGRPRELSFGDKRVSSGICKHAVSGPVVLTKLGFEGDAVANTRYHGGLDKAVCVYSGEHYPSWEEELGRTLPPAAFGENLTLSGFEEHQLCIGDVLSLGEARVQVTQPRQPCGTLALRLACEDLVERIVRTARCGFYLRVLSGGAVCPEDSLSLLERDPGGVTVARAHRVRHHSEDGVAGLDEVLAVDALSASWRESLSRRRAT